MIKTSLDFLRSSLAIFGYLPKCLENAQKRSSGPRDNFGKNLRKIIKNGVISMFIIKRTLHVSSKIWILCSRGKNLYLTSELCSLVRHSSCHSNIKFVSSRHRVISSILYLYHSPVSCPPPPPSSSTWYLDASPSNGKSHLSRVT